MVPLSYLFERIKFTFGSKVNAPRFGWAVYNDSEPPFIRGHTRHKQKHWSGITIDKAIPTKIITELNSINSIEARASCQGTLTDEKNKLEVPTYFIFRTKIQDLYYIEKVVRNLNSYPDIKAGFRKGNEGKLRICVVGDMSYDTDPHAFGQWWNSLPTRIRKAL